MRIRPYNDKDLPKIQEMFLAGTMSGQGSPYSDQYALLSAQLMRSVVVCDILLIALYLCLSGSPHAPPFLSRPPSLSIPLLSLALLAAPLLAWCYFIWYSRRLHRVFLAFVNDGLAGDLSDVRAHYGLETGRGAFWVAVVSGQDGKADESEEVVGYVGLDLQPSGHSGDQDAPPPAGLQRLVVSPAHRRRGVASALMDVAVAHARVHGVRELALTTSVFHHAARSAYERSGWVVRSMRDTKFGGVTLPLVFYGLRLD